MSTTAELIRYACAATLMARSAAAALPRRRSNTMHHCTCNNPIQTSTGRCGNCGYAAPPADNVVALPGATWTRVPPAPLTTRLQLRAMPLLRSRTKEVPEYTSIGPECFAGTYANGRTVVCWKGENYVKMRPTLRTRLHNRLVSRLNVRWPNGVTQ